MLLFSFWKFYVYVYEDFQLGISRPFWVLGDFHPIISLGFLEIVIRGG